jgi:hypothetical protein
MAEGNKALNYKDDRKINFRSQKFSELTKIF